MDSYLIPILWALIFFPFIAFLFTIPYALNQYHKFGSIPMIRVGIVYSFILYLLAAYFLVILPLPDMQEVAAMTGPTTQFIPFQFVIDFIQNTSFVITNPQTYLKALTEPWCYQVLYNLILLLPFGLYLRYYFKCDFKKTVLLTFLFSLFFELTQLSGLYGIYPRAYRLFDVDDLMINTLGGILGFFIAGLAMKILPSRDHIDSYAYQKGKEITGWKRFTCFFLDWFLETLLLSIGSVITFLIPQMDYRIYALSIFLIYFIFVPIVNQGRTFGKQFLNMKLVKMDGSDAKWYQYIIRYLLLYGILLPFPIYLLRLGIFIYQCLPTDISSIFVLFGALFYLLFAFLYYTYFIVLILRQKTLWYEKVSHTKNISTVEQKKNIKEDQTNTEKTYV